MLGQTVTSSLTLLLFVAYLVYALYIFYFYLYNYLMLFSPPRRCSKSERYESDKQKKNNEETRNHFAHTKTPPLHTPSSRFIAFFVQEICWTWKIWKQRRRRSAETRWIVHTKILKHTHTYVDVSSLVSYTYVVEEAGENKKKRQRSAMIFLTYSIARDDHDGDDEDQDVVVCGVAAMDGPPTGIKSPLLWSENRPWATWIYELEFL